MCSHLEYYSYNHKGNLLSMNLYPISTDNTRIKILLHLFNFSLILTNIPSSFPYSSISTDKNNDMFSFSLNNNYNESKTYCVISSSYIDNMYNNILNPSLPNVYSSALNSNFIIYKLNIFNSREPYFTHFFSNALGPITTYFESLTCMFCTVSIFLLIFSL